MPDSELSALTEQTAPADDDILYLCDAGGTIDRKVKVSKLRNASAVFGEAYGSNGSNQTISTGAGLRTKLIWTGGTSGWWSSGASTKLVVPTGMDGTFIIVGRALYEGGGTNYRDIVIEKNTSGADLVMERMPAAPSGIHQSLKVQSRPIALVATDWVELVARHNSSGSAIVDHDPAWTYLYLYRIGA